MITKEMLGNDYEWMFGLTREANGSTLASMQIVGNIGEHLYKKTESTRELVKMQVRHGFERQKARLHYGRVMRFA